MAIKLVYSVFDAKAEGFLPPIFVDAKGIVMRMFVAAANDSSHDFCKFAEDYTLFELGEFNDRTGYMDLYDGPRSVATALSVRKEVK